MDDVAAVLDKAEGAFDASQERLLALIRIPSVSAQPAYAADCRRAADWMRDQFAGLGFTSAVRETAGHCVVVAHHPGPKDGTGPHLLYYGHYDVQPVEPLELWTSPPFEPIVVQGPHGARVVGRGAVDNKGQAMMWLEAFRAWNAVGGPPVRVTVLLEGEEEIGSPSLDAFLAANAAELRADVAVISDTGMWNIDTPAITTRLRGSTYVEIGLHAASRDLHSGLFGGSAVNPINALARILGDLHDAEGHIQLPGFYDGVRDVAPEQAEAWEALAFDEAAFLGRIGLSAPAGERDRSALERLWTRPTADVTGIWGGYTGPGAKTIIPAEAHAKLSLRLVPGQDPAAMVESVKRFVTERLPAGTRATFDVFFQTAGIGIPSDSRWVRAAQTALAAEYGRPAALIGSGGSIPVVESFHRILGMDSLLVGFGLDDDQVHSPNEKFEMRCFHKGIRSHIRLLGEIAAESETMTP